MKLAVEAPPLHTLTVAGRNEKFPVSRVFCVGRNYAAHAREMGKDPDRDPPCFFMKPANAVVDATRPTSVPYPPKTKNYHHEIELVVAIGKGGHDIAVSDALEHVYGYAVGLDMTRRDLQLEARDKGRPWEFGKSFAKSAPIGALHRVQEVDHPESAAITLQVNGQPRQSSDVGKLIWSVAECVAYLSEYETLEPGDIIMTGTPEGVSAVVAGDLMCGAIAGLGEIEVYVEGPGAAVPQNSKETSMGDTSTVFPTEVRWVGVGTSRIPVLIYTSDELYKRELERFFYKDHWCYVGLEAEVPKPGDFKRTVLGERSVIMVRDAEGDISVVENVCAHRGMRFCRERHGNRKEFVCPYHQWSYTLKGDLQGVPFRRGVKQDGQVHGGMPADFKTSEHGLTKLKVATRGGVVFASFDPNVESLEDFLGATILGYFDRLFNGRKLKILGYNRQRIPGNWKLMQENIKDPYHPGLLHTWFVTFGLWRADNKSQLRMDEKHRHAAMISTRGTAGKSEQVTQVSSFKESMQLNDPSFLDIVPEPWWGGPTAVMTTIFPSVILQQQVNSVSTRHIQPTGHGSFDFVWTHFGFEDDTEEMTQRRLRQANLFGPAGFVSADDGEVIEFSQQAFESKPFHRTLAELGGREVEDTEHMVTETLIRGMYRYWREVMTPTPEAPSALPPQGGATGRPAEPDPRWPPDGARSGAGQRIGDAP